LPPSVKHGKFAYPSVVVSKSPNKLNRVYLSAEPLSDEICDAIENDRIKLQSNMKEFGRKFAAKFDGWSKEEAARIWSFGCAPYGKANVLVDQTKAVDYLDKIKSSIIEGFRQITAGGILSDEPLRGVRFTLLDAKIHPDPSHHGAGQIISATTRACKGALLASSPCLYEPMYEVNIEVPMDGTQGVFNTFGKVRGDYVSMQEKKTGKNMCEIIASVPILETLKNEKEGKVGFTELLRQNTQGKAFASMKFSHWQKVAGDPLVKDSVANSFVMNIRNRKEKMKMEIPSFTDYYDKIN
jgi:elongation factor 2